MLKSLQETTNFLRQSYLEWQKRDCVLYQKHYKKFFLRFKGTPELAFELLEVHIVLKKFNKIKF